VRHDVSCPHIQRHDERRPSPYSARLCIGALPVAAAQGRFELISGDAVAAVQGLGVYTVRDNRTAVCYTLFVLGAFDADSSRDAPQGAALTSADVDKIRLADVLRNAQAIRDQKVAALRSSSVIGWTAAQYAFARAEIDDEYERTVRALLPGLHPANPIMPAMRTTSTDELNVAVRQAIADADAVITAQSRSASDDRTVRLLNQMSQSPRLAVAGPAPLRPVHENSPRPTLTMDDTWNGIPFSLVHGGPTFELSQRAHLSGPSLEWLHRRTLALALFAWLPLLLLCLLDGSAFAGAVKIPFLYDIETHARCLIAIPC
jgi:hypothetical protein